MLQQMRSWATGWLAWIIIGFVGLVFVMWGLSGNFGHSFNRAIAKVGDQDITPQEFQRVFDRYLQQQQAFFAKNNLGIQPNEAQVKQEALNALITDRALLQDATKLGVQVTRDQVDQVIVNLPQFQDNGKFSEEKFTEFATALQTNTSSLRQQIEHSISVNVMREALIASEFALPKEVEYTLALLDQRRDAGYAVFKESDYVSKVKLDKNAVNQFYTAHQNEYRTAEQLKLNYLRLNKEQLTTDIKITPEQVKETYEKNKNRYTVPERRFVSHILILVPKDAAKDVDEKAHQQMIALRKEATKQNFAELAKKHSQDSATANEGGSLGWVIAGEMDPKFNDAMFAMKIGDVSDPVRTVYGWHLIYLSDIQPAKIEQLTPQLSSEIERDLKNQAVGEKMAKRLEDLATLTYQTPDSLQQAADGLGLKVQETGYFERKGGTDFTANPKLLRAAFSDEVLTQHLNSEVIELAKDDYVVVRVADYKPSTVKPFSEVEKQVTDDATKAKAAELAQQAGTEFKDALNKKADPIATAKQMNVSWQTKSNMARDEQTVPAPLVYAIFETPKPAPKTTSAAQIVSLNDGDFAVMQVLAVNPGDKSKNNADLNTAITQRLSQVMAILDYEAYVKDVLANTKIKVYDKNLTEPQKEQKAVPKDK